MAQNMNNMNNMGQMGQMNQMGQPMNNAQMGQMGQPISAGQVIGNLGQGQTMMGQNMNNAQMMGQQSVNSPGMANMNPQMTQQQGQQQQSQQQMSNIPMTAQIQQGQGSMAQPMSTQVPMSTMGPVPTGAQMGSQQPTGSQQPMGSGVQPMGSSGLAGTPPEAPPTLVDDFEKTFLACLAPLMDGDMTNQDADEMRAGVQQSLQRFLDSAKALEAFFLQKRLLLSVQKPELLVKEDITDLRSELTRKEQLIQKHYEKLGSWMDMLSTLQQQPQAPQPQTVPAPPPTNPGTPQQGAPQQGAPRHAPPQMAPQQQAAMQSPHHMHQMAAPQFPQISRQQFHPGDAMMQGPLAKLERSTANIGMPDGWQ